jgi:two-component system, chemotaxis family, protein-glutamate methylesterase/glutaminase
LGRPSPFVCPECNGPLWELKNKTSLLFRCLVGHAYAPEHFVAAQSEELERAFWIALRALEERIELHQVMAERARRLKQPLAAKQYTTRVQENSNYAKIIREVLEKSESTR